MGHLVYTRAVNKPLRSSCPEKAPTRAVSLLKVPIIAFTIKNLGQYAKPAFKRSMHRVSQKMSFCGKMTTFKLMQNEKILWSVGKFRI